MRLIITEPLWTKTVLVENVRNGQIVRHRQEISEVGKTGQTTGSHFSSAGVWRTERSEEIPRRGQAAGRSAACQLEWRRANRRNRKYARWKGPGRAQVKLRTFRL